MDGTHLEWLKLVQPYLERRGLERHGLERTHLVGYHLDRPDVVRRVLGRLRVAIEQQRRATDPITGPVPPARWWALPNHRVLVLTAGLIVVSLGGLADWCWSAAYRR